MTVFKKAMAFLLAAGLLIGTLGGCKPTGSGDGEKETVGGSYTRQYRELRPAVEGAVIDTSFSPRFRDEHTLSYVYSRLSEADTFLYVWSLLDLRTGEQTEMYRTEYSYDASLIDFAVDWQSNLLWLQEYHGGDRMFGGTQEDRNLLRVVDLATGETAWELNITEQLGAVAFDAKVAVSGNKTAYALCEYEDDEARGFALMLVDFAGKGIAHSQKIPDITNASLLPLAEGQMGLLLAKEGEVLPIKKGTCEPGAPVKPLEKSAPANFFGGNGEGQFLYEQGGCLYGYTAQNGTAKPLVTWQDWGVIFDETNLIQAAIHNGVITCVVKNGLSIGAYVLTPCAPDKVAADLLVAGYGINDGVVNAAMAFNQTRFDYTVRIEDYRKYDGQTVDEMLAEDDPFRVPDGVTKLNTELLAGKEIDVLCFGNQVSTASLIRQEALLDLYPLIDKDVGRDYFVPGLLEATETGGHMYHLSTGFTLDTLVGNREIVGDVNSLTIDGLEAAEKAHPAVPAFPAEYTRTHFVRYLANVALVDYVKADWSAASFDSPHFVRYLEKSGELLSSDEYSDLIFSGSDTGPKANNAAIANGSYLFVPGKISSFMFYQRVLSDTKGKAQFTGYLTENGVGHVMELVNTVGILANSKHQEVAWDFLKQCLATNQYEPLESPEYGAYFPADKVSFDRQLAYYQDPANFVYPDGTFATTFEGNQALPLTEDDAAVLYQMIEDAKAVVDFDTQIYEIMAVEASYYYAGQCTAAEAAEKIQSRVSLYLKEQN